MIHGHDVREAGILKNNLPTIGQKSLKEKDTNLMRAEAVVVGQDNEVADVGIVDWDWLAGSEVEFEFEDIVIDCKTVEELTEWSGFFLWVLMHLKKKMSEFSVDTKNSYYNCCCYCCNYYCYYYYNYYCWHSPYSQNQKYCRKHQFSSAIRILLAVPSVLRSKPAT